MTGHPFRCNSGRSTWKATGFSKPSWSVVPRMHSGFERNMHFRYTHINNKLLWARQYARIVVRGYYLFREANSVAREQISRVTVSVTASRLTKTVCFRDKTYLLGARSGLFKNWLKVGSHEGTCCRDMSRGRISYAVHEGACCGDRFLEVFTRRVLSHCAFKSVLILRERPFWEVL